MIAAVRGEVLDIALDHAVIDAAGVGYKVMATPTTLATLHRGAEARLITAMIVREDAMTLYGFADADARNLFLTLIGVSGIGPSIALGALAMYDGPTLRQAIGDGDVTALTRIPKVGKKTAELLVLTLRDKVGAGPRPVSPRPAVTVCADRSSKRSWVLASRSSMLRRLLTKCSPMTPVPISRAHCAPGCPCSVGNSGPIRRGRPGGRRSA